jgi:SAM-dependent methyltransferase
MTATAPPQPDQERLMAFVGGVIGDLGALTTAGQVVIGHRLGLYTALAAGPATAAELAGRTGCDARYLTEWCRGQAAGGYIGYDAEADTYALSPEQAFCLTDPMGPMYLPAAFQLALGALRAEPRITEAFRTGEGMGWHEHEQDVFDGCAGFFRSGYLANLTTAWLPALTGVVEKLRGGAVIADVGCGQGASSVLLAEAYPDVRVRGSDYHGPSVTAARAAAAAAGVDDRVDFEVAAANAFSGEGYDLVCSFDSLHDMGDPVGAARYVRQVLDADGTWMIVEPNAGDRPADNLNPVGRAYYGFSTFLCVPNGLSQPGGYALGAQAGEAAIRRIVTEAGFTRFRRAAETPFNAVFEVRP